MRISDWSSDVCSSDLPLEIQHGAAFHFLRQMRGSSVPKRFVESLSQAFPIKIGNVHGQRLTQFLAIIIAHYSPCLAGISDGNSWQALRHGSNGGMRARDYQATTKTKKPNRRGQRRTPI